MVIKEFSAINFRNYRELFVTFSTGINIFFGENGQGKSNLAEGIYFLSHLDSFRTHKLDQLPTFGSSVSYLQGTILRSGSPQKARIEVSKRGRRVWLNEEPVQKLSAYISSFYAIVLNPDSLYNYRHFPSERRLVFDRFLSFIDRDYLEAIRDFRAVHAQKNKLLKTGQISSLPEWNQLFVEKGCVIINKRQELMGAINVFLPSQASGLTGREGGLRINHKPSLNGDREKDLQMLARVSDQEVRAGHALYGPHRDDFEMNLEGERTEVFFSQGEYRISLLALKMALNEMVKTRMGVHPVIILDDLYSELDRTVRQSLTEYLTNVANQIFITTTESPNAVGLPSARVMEIRAGGIV